MVVQIIGKNQYPPESGSVQSVAERVADVCAASIDWLNTFWVEPPDMVDAAHLPLGYIVAAATPEVTVRGDMLAVRRRFTTTFLLRSAAFGVTNRPLLGLWSKLDDITLALADNLLSFEGNRLRGLTTWVPENDTGYRLIQYPPVQDAPVFHGFTFNHVATVQVKLERKLR